MTKKMRTHDEMQGEGNRDADRRYRRAVKKTVKATSEDERAVRARELSGKEQKAAHSAESKGRARARS